MGAPHRIRRFRCRVAVPSAAAAFAARPVVRRALEDQLLHRIEAVFEELGGGSDVIQIDRLDLRVRLDGLATLERDLPVVVAAAARARLAELAPRRGSAGGIARRRTAAEHAGLTLLTYLRTGTVPAPAPDDPVESMEALRRFAALGWERILDAEPALARSAPALLRLLQLLPESRWPAVARAAAGSLPVPRRDHLARLVGRLASLLPAEIPHRRMELAAAITLLAQRQAGPEDAVWAERVVRRSISGGPARSMAPLRALLGARPTRGAATAPGGTKARPGAGRVESPGLRHAPAKPAEVSPDRPASLVPSAGLILLHPFLPPLFRAAGLLEGSGIPNELLPRAAALLHWLATGADDAAEFELPLVKVLVGRAPEVPVVIGGGVLRDADMREATAVLESVITHWAALRGTSVAGLRTSFLRRTGLLREADDGWRLQPMPEGFDVLLNHLPWGIGVVRLPWMPRPIYVEWPMP